MDLDKSKQTRRQAIKTAGKFIIPTLVTFQLTELKAHATSPVSGTVGSVHPYSFPTNPQLQAFLVRLRYFFARFSRRW